MTFLATVQTHITHRQAYEGRLPSVSALNPKKPHVQERLNALQQQQNAIHSPEMQTLQTAFFALTGLERRKLCAIARAGTYGDGVQVQFNCIGEEDTFALSATSSAIQTGLAKVSAENLDIEADWTSNAPALPVTPSTMIAQSKLSNVAAGHANAASGGAKNGTPTLP